jgi:MFS transporter, DHA2 family, multidrug resistance protein
MAAGWFERTGDQAYAQMRALGQLAGQIAQQALVMTYSELFFVLAVTLLCCIPFALILKTPRIPVSTGEAH